jgi:hypothetical protein
MPTQMHHRNNQNIAAFNRVDDSVREAACPAPAERIIQGRPRFRMRKNMADDKAQLAQESEAQARHPILVKLAASLISRAAGARSRKVISSSRLEWYRASMLRPEP